MEPIKKNETIFYTIVVRIFKQPNNPLHTEPQARGL
jgi:hypothetical protein